MDERQLDSFVANFARIERAAKHENAKRSGCLIASIYRDLEDTMTSFVVAAQKHPDDSLSGLRTVYASTLGAVEVLEERFPANERRSRDIVESVRDVAAVTQKQKELRALDAGLAIVTRGHTTPSIRHELYQKLTRN